MKRLAGACIVLLASYGLAGAQAITEEAIRAATGPIDTAAIIANDQHDRNWLNYGLNYAETRFSQLKGVDASNVGKLGLAWS